MLAELEYGLDNVDWANPVSDHALNRGLVGWWLGGGVGFGSNKWFDISGRSLHATLTNMEPNTDWKGGGRTNGSGYLDFGGTNEYAIGSSNLPISGNAAFSYGGWVYWSSGSWAAGGSFPSPLGNNSTGTAGQGLSFTFEGGRPAVDFWVNRWRASSALNVQQWYHVFGTKIPGDINSATTKIYVNGVEVAGGAEGSPSAPNITASPVVMGRLDGSSAGRYWNGFLDDLRVFNRTLSAVDVQSLYLDSLQGHPRTLNRIPRFFFSAPDAGGASVSPLAFMHLQKLSRA